MKVIVSHPKHYAWVPLPSGTEATPDERTRPAHPDFPNGPVHVRRLVDSDDGTKTVMEISSQAHIAMSAAYAAAQGLEPTDKHFRTILARHVNDVIHEHHSPSELWGDIVVTEDDGTENPELTSFLRRRLLDEVPDGTEA